MSANDTRNYITESYYHGGSEYANHNTATSGGEKS